MAAPKASDRPVAGAAEAAPDAASDRAEGPPGPADAASQTDGEAADPPAPHLTLIGTGHVFRIEEAVKDAIEALAPDVVFVELDKGRLQALIARRQGGTPPRSGNFVHRKLQGFQESVANLYGAEAGGEMIAAVEGAQRVGAQVALVDRPAEETLKRLMKQLTWRERGRAAWLMLKGGLGALVPRRRDRKGDIESEIRKYSEDPDAALAEVGREFPTVRRVVIDERDALMAERIRHAMGRFRRGVAVVGDGHVGGMRRHLDDLPMTVYRLGQVREGALPKPEGREATGTPESVSFGFQTEV